MINKKHIIGLMFLVMLTGVMGLSNPVNQSITEFNNLTRVDNALELAQEMNQWVGGGFGIMVLVIIFGAAFGITMFYTQTVSKSLVLAFFIEVLSAVLLRMVSLVPDVALYYSFPMFLLSIGFAVVSR